MLYPMKAKSKQVKVELPRQCWFVFAPHVFSIGVASGSVMVVGGGARWCGWFTVCLDGGGVWAAVVEVFQEIRICFLIFLG